MVKNLKRSNQKQKQSSTKTTHAIRKPHIIYTFSTPKIKIPVYQPISIEEEDTRKRLKLDLFSALYQHDRVSVSACLESRL